MLTKSFLEEYPLYKKVKANTSISYNTLRYLRTPSIKMYCEHCNSRQTFNVEEDVHLTNGCSKSVSLINKVFKVKYQCRGCQKFIRYFSIYFDKLTEKYENENGDLKEREKIYYKKVGQHPAWSIEPEKDIKKAFENNNRGDLLEKYKKAKITESQGYGVGSFAYYRQIVESVIDDFLLDDLLKLAKEKGDDNLIEKIKEADGEKNVTDKIDLVKGHLPSSLRPGEINPLSVLYGELSDHLHNKDDEDCLKKSAKIRKSLLFLIKEITKKSKEAEDYKNSMQDLLDSKS